MASELLQPAYLAALMASGAALVDLEAAPPYFRERRHIPGSIVARRSMLLGRLDRIPGTGPIVLTSLEGARARLATTELLWRTRRHVLAVAGGTAGWIAAGLGEPGQGLNQPALDPSEALPRPPTLDERHRPGGLRALG
jgi:hypothetical protein